MNSPGLTILDRIIELIIDPLILLIFSIGFLVFLWGLLQFMMNPEDTARRDAGKSHMIWGVVGMLIMISVEGIITLIQDTFDLQRPGIEGGPFDPGAGGAGKGFPFTQ